MSWISTDNPARRQKFVWLGDPSFPWPFDATGTAWIVGTITVPACVAAAGALIGPLLGLLLPGAAGTLAAVLLAVVIGTLIGVLITRAAGRVISPTRPVRHHTATFLTEVTAPRQEPVTEHTITVDDTIWVERDPARTKSRTVPVPEVIE